MYMFQGVSIKVALVASAILPMVAFANATRVYDVDDYIQDGLILHFDGIRNVGADAPHDVSATVWKNLGSLGNAHDATLATLPDANVAAAAKDGAWTENGYAFGGKNYFALGGTIALGNAVTVQTAVDYDKANQVGSYPVFFGATSNDSDYFAFYSTKSDAPINFKLFNKTTHSNSSWTPPYATAIYDDVNSRIYVAESTIPDWMDANSGVAGNLNAKSFAIGTARSSDGAKANRILVGTNHFIRVYTKVLNSLQLAWNRAVDEQRYNTAGYLENHAANLEAVNVTLVSDAVVSDYGDGWMGKYIVTGWQKFTAPEQISTSGNTSLVCAGYAVETWDDSSSNWNIAVTNLGKRAYTYISDAGKVRVTWIWRERNARRVFDVNDYVQDGLILHFDGIRNAGADSAHDANAAKWKNLVDGQPDASFVRKDEAFGRWKDGNGFYFGGKSELCGAWLDEAVALGPNMTIQVAVDVDVAKQQSYNTESVYPAYFCGAAPDFGLFQGTWGQITPTRFSFKHRVTYSTDSEDIMIDSGWIGRYATAVLSDNRSYLTQTVSLGSGLDRNPGTAAAQRYSWGTRVNSKGVLAAGRAVLGTFHSVRVYEDALNDEQIAWNRMVDNERFHMEKPNEVNVIISSNIDNVSGNDECGSYAAIEGYQFKAPTLKIIDGFVYTFNGYTLETWNGSAWSEAVEYDGKSIYTATGSGLVRLTWHWSFVLRSAEGYDVDDYVQDGLILHFDGIRNVGADAPHDASATVWKNLGSLGSAHDAILTSLPETNVAAAAKDGAWTENGYAFGGKNYFTLGGTVALGNAVTVQTAVDYNKANQVGAYPVFFGVTSNNSDYFAFYSTKANADINFKLFNQTSHSISSWIPPYATAIYDDANSNIYIGESTNPTWIKANSGVTGNLVAKSFAIGTAQSSGAAKANRILVGTNHFIRVYTSVLNSEQLAQNREVDEIRFHAIGDVTVVNGAVGKTGVNGASNLPNGVYNVQSDSFSFTAENIVVDGVRYSPRLTVETWNGSEWVQTSKEWTGSYTYAASTGRVRLKWSWEIQTGFVIIFK